MVIELIDVTVITFNMVIELTNVTVITISKKVVSKSNQSNQFKKVVHVCIQIQIQLI